MAKTIWVRTTRAVGIRGAHHAAGDVAQLPPLDAFDALATNAAELLDQRDLERVHAARRAADARSMPRRRRGAEPDAWQRIGP